MAAPTIPETIAAFFAQYPLQHADQGAILLMAEEPPTGIYYLVEGQVRSYDITAQGNEVVVNVFKPGAFFPLSWAVRRIPNHYFFNAVQDCTYHVAPPDDVVAFLKANPEVAVDVIGRLYAGLEGVLGRMKRLMSGETEDRFLYELVLECRRFGQRRPDGSWFLSLNQSELAARSGLARETVSREIQKYKTLAKANRHGIIIYDLEALERVLKQR